MAEQSRVLCVTNPAALKTLCGVLIADDVSFTCIPREGELILLHPDGVELPQETQRCLDRLTKGGLIKGSGVDEPHSSKLSIAISPHEDLGPG